MPWSLCPTLGMEGCQALNQSLIPRGSEVMRVIRGRERSGMSYEGEEFGQLIGQGRIRNGEGPSSRWGKQGRGEGNRFCREQGMVDLGETLGGSNLEGEVH